MEDEEQEIMPIIELIEMLQEEQRNKLLEHLNVVILE